jgi:hypothetical protein
VAPPRAEPHGLKVATQGGGIRRRILDKFEPIGTHGIVEQIGHVAALQALISADLTLNIVSNETIINDLALHWHD